MRNIKFLLLLLFYGLFKSQNYNLPSNIKSPDVSNLGRYGEYDMSLAYGIPNINIPLISLKNNSLPLNVTLDYNASGVHVNARPSSVGQNWSLNIGGVVTRSVDGASNDELRFDTELPSQMGYYYKRALLNNTGWGTDQYLNELIRSTGSYNNNYAADLSPDVFSFNFMGISGKFFLGEDGKWKVQSKDNLKIEINMDENKVPLNFNPRIGACYPYGCSKSIFPKTIYKIIIYDDKGNKYVFGGTDNAIEYCFPNFFDQTNLGIIASAWHLTNVYDSNGKELYSFKYKRFGYQASFNLQLDEYKISNKGFGWLDSSCSYGNVNAIGSVNSNFLEPLATGSLMLPSFLEKIYINGGQSEIKILMSESNSLNFNDEDRNVIKETLKREQSYLGPNDSYDDWSYGKYWAIRTELDGVTKKQVNLDPPNYTFIFNNLKTYKVTNIQLTHLGKIINNIDFLYNDSSIERLFLNKIINNEDTYKFEYNRKNELPGYLSKKIDHWGFYKGTDFSVNRNNYNDHFNTRNANFETLTVGTLSKIIFPTQGYTRFVFEPHSYSTEVNENRQIVKKSSDNIAGGIRIAMIKNYSNNDTLINEKFFQYKNDNNQSSGILLSPIKYFFPDWEVRTNSGRFNKMSFSINSLISDSKFSNNHILYSQVREVTTGKGSITYTFTDYEEYPDFPYLNTSNISHSIFDAFIDSSFKRGKEKTIEYKDNNNQTLLKKTFNYEYEDSYKIRAVNYEFLQACDNTAGQFIVSGNAYYKYYGNFNVIKKENIEYFPNGNLFSSTQYNYTTIPGLINGASLVEGIKNIDSSGNVIEQKFKYAGDLRHGNSPHQNVAPYQFLPDMVVANMTGIPLVIANYKNGLFQNRKQTIFEKNSQTGSIQPKNELFYNVDKTQILSGFGFPADVPIVSFAETEIIYDQYDSKGNLLQYTTKGGMSTVIVWGYNKTLPIMKIEGKDASYAFSMLNDHIEVLSLASNKDIDEPSEITFRAELDLFQKRQFDLDIQITTYTHNPLVGVTSITPPSGIREFYYYDNANRLKEVRDVNGKILKEYKYNYKQ